jgi:hypothetical protein
MRHPFRWLAGTFALLGFLRSRRPRSEAPDPRADDLRRRLEESRAIVEERDEFEAGETPVDQAEHAPADPDERRRAVHDAGHAAAERMRERRY